MARSRRGRGKPVSAWQDQRAERNRQSVVRLTARCRTFFRQPCCRARLCSSIRAADAAACDQFLLARASASRRPSGAGAGAKKRRARRLDLAAYRQSQKRIADDIPYAARALSRTRLFARRRFLLRVRAAGLPLRLACRSVAWRTKQECQLALRLRGRLAILERAERGGAAASPPAGAALRGERRAAVENRRNRPPRAAVPGVGRAARDAVAQAPRLLGPAQPAGDQSRRPRRQMRCRGARPSRGAGGRTGAYRLISPRLMLVPRLASSVFVRPLEKICTV